MAPKKIVQDIMPSKRRSIREVSRPSELSRADRGIRVPMHVEHAPEAERASVSASASPKNQQKKEPRVGKKKKAGRNIKWLIGGVAIVCCIVVAYVVSVFFARAKVAITPRSESVSINSTYVAAQNAQSPNLSFITVSTTTTAHVSIAAVAQGTVNTYAKGTALLINASSGASQKIVAGTRLIDGRGLIYKTVSTVVIPKATSKASGTVAVRIVASLPGFQYDSSLSSLKGDLAFVAWEGTSKAMVFYGRMTSNMIGGASGLRMAVASSTLASATTALTASLSAMAQDSLKGRVPSGYILYPTAIALNLSSTTVVSTGSTTADVSMSAAVTGFLFKTSDLENALAKSEIAQFPADNYRVDGLSSLVFSPLSGQSLSRSSPMIKFTLSGSLDIVGLVDTDSVVSQLEGKPLSASNKVFSQYSTVISSAQVSIVPFWIRSIPSSPRKITMVVSTTTSAGH
ncbi:MAG: hypothetical protein P4L61_03675 [Candidatus Pacebacteria bacterium]|nr:hypothetical protein [Candidatus Paceibacterota bacterium]